MHKKIVERYFFFSLLILTIIFVLFILSPFLATMAVGASLAVALYPAFLWFTKHKLPHWLSALIIVFVFIVALCAPLFGLGTIVFRQSQDVYHSIIDGGKTGAIVDSVNKLIDSMLPAGTSIDIRENTLSIVSFLSNNIAQVFTYTLSTIFTFFLALLVLFYCLKDGDHWVKSLVELSPLSKTDDTKIINKLTLAINGVIKGYLLIAVLQGILMGFGLALFGVPDPALWGVVAAVASLIPVIGTAFISVPAIIFLFVTGNTFQAVGLLLWAGLVVGTIDNILNPIVVGNNVQVPPLLILMSVLGGIALMGPVGILIGPLAVSLLHTLLSIYKTGI